MTKETKTTPLDALAAQAQAFESAPLEGAPGQPAPSEEQITPSMEKIEAGMVKVLMMALKVGRALIARKLPEIKDEWPDELLEAPAEAALPLVKKYLGNLMVVVGQNEELAALVIALFPLGMGVLSAMEKADQREKREAAAAQSGDTALAPV